MHTAKVSQAKLALTSMIVCGALATGLQAEPSTAEAFDKCRAEAQVAYGTAEQPARIRLDGTRKAGTQLAMRVFTPEGKVLRAFCNLDRETGQMVSLDPPAAPGKDKQLSDARN